MTVQGDRHHCKTYLVTGGSPMSLAEATERLAAATGDGARYREVSQEEARQAFSASGRPAWFVSVLLELVAAFDTGAVGLHTSTFRDLTGHDPRTFESFAREQRSRVAA